MVKLTVVKSPNTKGKHEADVDALFRLPLAEFTGARNALAAQLKKSGHGDQAALIKALSKPSVSAWAVNQLYWNYREVFDRLLASGEDFHKAQTSRLAGKLADMRGAMDARREALTQLSDLAISLLQDAGQNPSLDTIRRITTTLEAMSAYASRSDGPRPGRLTQDVDPPGFESLASFIPDAGVTKTTKEPARVTPTKETRSVPADQRRKVAPATGARELEAPKAGIAAAKVSLQDAKRVLSKAEARAQTLQAAQKKADAEAKEAEKQRRQAEERLKKAQTAWGAAAKRAQSIADQVEAAAETVEDARRAVEKASNDLETLQNRAR